MYTYHGESVILYIFKRYIFFEFFTICLEGEIFIPCVCRTRFVRGLFFSTMFNFSLHFFPLLKFIFQIYIMIPNNNDIGQISLPNTTIYKLLIKDPITMKIKSWPIAKLGRVV